MAHVDWPRILLLDDISIQIHSAIYTENLELLESLLNTYPGRVSQQYKIRVHGGTLRVTPLEHVCWLRVLRGNKEILLRMDQFIKRHRSFAGLPAGSFTCREAPPIPIAAAAPAAPANRPVVVNRPAAAVAPAGHIIPPVPVPTRQNNLYLSDDEEEEEENTSNFSLWAEKVLEHTRKGGAHRTRRQKKQRHNSNTKNRNRKTKNRR